MENIKKCIIYFKIAPLVQQLRWFCQTKEMGSTAKAYISVLANQPTNIGATIGTRQEIQWSPVC